MSATASAILVESPAYFEAPRLEPSTKETIGNLVHELRQPLSSMEAISYFLEMTLPADQLQARQYMRRLQQLVADAELILERAVSAARKPLAQAITVAAS
jgi:phosphoglycerate-specific signal transduction histidine kinase